MRALGLVVIAITAACGGGDGSARPDGEPFVHDAFGTTGHDAMWKPGPSMSRVLFLQTEGVTVTAGATDATMDRSTIVATTATLKPWRMGDASRTTELAALATEIAGIVAPYQITVVTTRPSSGTYHEIIVTDDAPSAIGEPSSVGAVAEISQYCNTKAAPVSFVFPSASAGTTYTQAMADVVTNAAIAMFGVEGGVPLSNAANDCMCFSASNCGQGSGACTIGRAGTLVDTHVPCGDNETTMDEDAMFRAAFGAQ